MKNKPLFSVAVISFENQNQIKQCIDSILNQTYENIELIVCDDNSCDFDCVAIAEYINKKKNSNIQNVVVYKQPENVGTSANCQTALDISNGEYFYAIAADDYISEIDILKKMQDSLKMEDVNVLCCRAQACYRDGEITTHFYPPLENMEKARNSSPYKLFELITAQPLEAFICSSSVFWKSDFLRKMGGYSSEYHYASDVLLWLKISAQNEKISFSNTTTTIYRYGGVFNNLNDLNQALIRKRYKEILDILENYSMPRIRKEHSIFSRVRSWHSVESLKARMVAETEWRRWSLTQKIVWRIKELPLLMVERLFFYRKHGIHYPYGVLVKGLFLAIICHNVDKLLYPSLDLSLLWSVLFLGSIVGCGIGLILNGFVFGAKMLLDIRLRRS